jgi:hypothetical protein
MTSFYIGFGLGFIFAHILRIYFEYMFEVRE